MANSEQFNESEKRLRRPGVSKGVYSLCYYVSFGAVYASRLAMEVIPPDSVVRQGLRDGAEAARHAWVHTHGEDFLAESEMELPHVVEDVVEDAVEDAAEGAVAGM